MIALKIIVGICVFTSIFSFFWYLRETKIIEKSLTAARGSIEETTARRQVEAHANLLIRDKKNKTRFEKIIENHEKLYTYSRIGKIVRGLSFEVWAVLVVLTTAGAYLGTLIITKNTMTGLLAAVGYYLIIKIAEMILAKRNFKTIDKSLLEFLNQLGNFSAIQGEITNVLHQTAQYTPPILAEALEGCYIEAQTTGNVSAALMGLADQFEHEKFKEIIINLEVCSRYTANLKVIVDSLRRNLMDAKRASQERRAIADSAIIEMVILSVMLLIVLLVVDTMVKASIWDILFHSLVGYIALGVAGICYLIFGLAIMKDFVKAINQRNDIDFVIHGGDMSDFGLTKEFLWQRDIMNGLHVPYVALIGNHDCLGTGAETYKAVFGPTNFSFIAGDVKFVCLNTNALEYDYSEPVPDFTFMENEITNRRDEFEKTVICMHARPYTDVFNDNVAKVFQHYVKQYAGIQFCTAAHTHHHQDDVIFDDGIHYVTSDCMDYRTYLVFTITPEKYEYELVKY